MKNGGRSTVVSTEGLSNAKDNIINIFGNKQLASLVDVDMLRPSDDDLAAYKCDQLPETMPLPFSTEFLVSSVVHGNGRSTTDRQFYYINSRPCEFPRLSSLVNDIYRQFNKSQYPFVYLNIITQSLQIDVNITPDKRKVFLEKENILLATIKTSLMEIFKSFSGTFQMDSFNLSQNCTITDFLNTSNEESQISPTKSNSDSQSNGSILERFKKRSRTKNDKDRSSAKKKAKTDTKLDYFLSNTEKNTPKGNFAENKRVCRDELDQADKIGILEKDDQDESIKNQKVTIDDNTVSNQFIDDLRKNQVLAETPEDLQKVSTESMEDMPQIIKINKIIHEDTKLSDYKDSTEILKISLKDTKVVTDSVQTDSITDDSIRLEKSIKLDWTINAVREALKSQKDTTVTNHSTKVRFRSEISPKSNKSAEQELQKHISKEDFAKMDIIGQFNHGFIITKFENDLFVIDQHATDEKYNFEQLQANTVMETQVLVR